MTLTSKFKMPPPKAFHRQLIPIVSFITLFFCLLLGISIHLFVKENSNFAHCFKTEVGNLTLADLDKQLHSSMQRMIKRNEPGPRSHHHRSLVSSLPKNGDDDDDNDKTFIETSPNCAIRLRLPQDSPKLIEYLRHYLHRKRRHLIPPSATSSPNNFSIDGGWNVHKIILSILNPSERREGFFVEAGAGDGISLSNTLALEVNYGWRGVLIEMNPLLFRKLVERRKLAWNSDLCLSSRSYPYKLKIGEYSTECFPLYTILKAMSVTIVDYLSLDLDDGEFGVLRDFPFHKDILIKIISISVTLETLSEINNLMISKGYRVNSYIKDKEGSIHEQMYVHPSVLVRLL